jgi:hypothetical protein
MKILGIDPGETFGACVAVSSPRIIEWKVKKIKDRNLYTRIAHDTINGTKLDLVIIEGKFRRKFERMSGKALETMEFRAYAWAAMAAYLGVPYEMIAPSTWMSYYGINAKNPYPNLARSMVGDQTVPVDACAAILIARYGEILLKNKNLGVT